MVIHTKILHDSGPLELMERVPEDFLGEEWQLAFVVMCDFVAVIPTAVTGSVVRATIRYEDVDRDVFLVALMAFRKGNYPVIVEEMMLTRVATTEDELEKFHEKFNENAREAFITLTSQDHESSRNQNHQA